jgi:hypothetical protein
MVASVVIKSYFTAVGYSFSVGGSAAAGDAVATLMHAVDNNDVSAAHSCHRPAQALLACRVSVEILLGSAAFAIAV